MRAARDQPLLAGEIAALLTQWEIDRGKSQARFDASVERFGSAQFKRWEGQRLTPVKLREAYDDAVAQRVSDNDSNPVNAGFMAAFVAKALAPPKPKPKTLGGMTHVELEAEGKRLGVNTHGLTQQQCIAKLDAARRAPGRQSA